MRARATMLSHPLDKIGAFWWPCRETHSLVREMDGAGGIAVEQHLRLTWMSRVPAGVWPWGDTDTG